MSKKRPSRPDASLLEKLEKEKRASVIQLLFRTARLLNERGVQRVRVKQGQQMRLAHAQLLPHIDFEGIRLKELAERAGLAKQTVGPIVAELETLGLVAVETDPSDRRAKRVRYTKAGTEALLAGLKVLGEMEAELSAELGRSTIGTLHDILLKLLGLLERDAS